jgi:uncharacterized protein
VTTGRRIVSRALPLLALLLLLAPRSAPASVDVPYLSGRVVDGAEILEEGTRRRLAELLEAHEKATTNQVVVLTVPTLGDASVEEYATAVFDSWKLGTKEKDNGILLLVAPSERRLRIEVGYGLEGVLPDVSAGRIIRNVITPRFKEGKFDAGVEEGVQSILAVLAGGEAPGDDPSGRSAFGVTVEGPELSIPMRILMGAFIFGIIGLFTFIGLVTPGAGWFLYFFLIPFWAMFPIVVVGVRGALAILATYVAGFPLAKLVLSRQAWYREARKALRTKGTARIGGFTIGGGGPGGTHGLSGSSGGGFSGGGGSSGGGGASGSW